MYVIQPTGGLCNYLRVIFSYYKKTCELNEQLVVIWNITSACNGFFLDYFIPIKNITFITHNRDNLNVNYNGCEPYNYDYNIDYSKLELKPELKNIILDKIKILNNNYHAIHVRRTDHTHIALINNRYTNDEMFFKFIDDIEDKKNIYIATDNEDTYNKFKYKYENYIKFNYHNKIDGFRETSLKDAIIDLYMCVYAKTFMGSGYSSYSELINALRII
jgi:hypothetical protein